MHTRSTGLQTGARVKRKRARYPSASVGRAGHATWFRSSQEEARDFYVYCGILVKEVTSPLRKVNGIWTKSTKEIQLD